MPPTPIGCYEDMLLVIFKYLWTGTNRNITVEYILIESFLAKDEQFYNIYVLEDDEVPRDLTISDLCAAPLERKGRVYVSCVRSIMTYGSETRPLQADVELKFETADMQTIRWMCGVSMKGQVKN